VKVKGEVRAMNRLRSLREAKGWSRSELARRAGLNQTTVSAIESGRLVAYPRQLAKLAGALGVAPDQAPGLCEAVSNNDEVGDGPR
jgi:transcriptional regulator with XRE-family HTH domain